MKKNNVIIINLKEPEKLAPNDRAQEDLECCNKIFKDEMIGKR